MTTCDIRRTLTERIGLPQAKSKTYLDAFTFPYSVNSFSQKTYDLIVSNVTFSYVVRTAQYHADHSSTYDILHGVKKVKKDVNITNLSLSSICICIYVMISATFVKK